MTEYKKIRNLLFIAMLAAVLVGCSGNGQSAAALDELEASAAIDITYCRAHWWMRPDTMFIRGAVATYFKSAGGKISTIDFDLVRHLQVDSVVSHNRQLAFSHSNDSLTVTLPDILIQGVTDSVVVYYHGNLKPTGHGSIRTNRKAHTIWTLSEPYGALDWWPCRQNLIDKIDSMDISVTCPKEYIVAANGVIVSDVADENERTTHYSVRHPLNYYTIGVAVGQYMIKEGQSVLATGDTVPFVHYYWPSDPLNVNEMMSDLNTMINIFSDYFIPYPFADEKYGQARISGGTSMEHQTMTFLAVPDNVVIMAHELAHQWFGNHVTCKGWQNVWINEGFASFGELLFLERYWPEMAEEWHDFTIEKALRANGTVYITDTSNYKIIFDETTTYRKGAMVLVMLRDEIGESAFQQGCRMILERFGNGFATIEDARQCFEQAADTSLVDFFNLWIYGSGYPQFTVDFDHSQAGKTIIDIQQSAVKTKDSDSDFFPMHLTVRLVGKKAYKDIRLHLTSPQQEFVVESDFKVNNVIFDPNKNILGTWQCEKSNKRN